MDRKAHTRRLDNCGHEIYLDYLSRVISSEYEWQSYCPFCRAWMLHTPEPLEEDGNE